MYRIDKRIFLPLIVILSINIGCDKGNAGASASGTNAQKTVAAETPKKWKKLINVSGEGNFQSELFELTGNQVQLKYRISGNDSGINSIYILESGKTLDQGAFPDLMENSPVTGTVDIKRKGGSYFLQVESPGNSWKFTLEELI